MAKDATSHVRNLYRYVLGIVRGDLMAIKVAAGWDGSLYLATRHFAGWYMVNVLTCPLRT